MKRIVEDTRDVEGLGMLKPMSEFVSEPYEEKAREENVEMVKGNVRRLKSTLKNTRQRIRREKSEWKEEEEEGGEGDGLITRIDTRDELFGYSGCDPRLQVE